MSRRALGLAAVPLTQRASMNATLKVQMPATALGVYFGQDDAFRAPCFSA